MTIWRNGSISRNLAILLLMALLPVLALLLYSGFEQRRAAIENTKQNVHLLTRSMAEVQRELAEASRQILSTLALAPAVQKFDIDAVQPLLTVLLEKNPNYLNFTLTALNGDVVTAANPTPGINLADRKHIRDALDNNRFAIGEFIITRVGVPAPTIAFAYPITINNGHPIGAITAAAKLTRFADFFDATQLPDQSFFAITDHQGILLYDYPLGDSSQIGQPIQHSARQTVLNSQSAGSLIGIEADGARQIIAFEPVRLADADPPYAYVWAGIPESAILKPVNTMLVQNLTGLFLIVGLALLATWKFGQVTLIAPITELAQVTRSFAQGTLPEQINHKLAPKEISSLTKSFYDLAATIKTKQAVLMDNEARFRLIMDSLDALVYVADMETFEILFMNLYGKKHLGDVTGHICWQTIQKGQSAPCDFCTNHLLVNDSGQPTGLHTWEYQNTQTGRWFYIHDRAITWVDGRLVRLEIATDITDKKLAEAALAQEKERLTVTLKSIGDGVITTDTEGRVAMLNPIAEALTGWSNKEATGKPLEEVFVIINEQTRKPCDNPVSKVIKSKKIVGLANHTALIAKDGTERSIADSGAPILADDGEIIGAVLVFRDVSENLQIAKELDRVKKIESLGILAGGIAHDFNNMLTAILGNLELSLHDQQILDKTRKRLENAVKASIRARDLTRQLQTFAKGGQPIKQTAALPEVIKDSADFVLHGKSVVCRYQFADDLHLVDIDKNQISQVVQNLILNAVQAMPQGGFIDVICDNATTDEKQCRNLVINQNYVKVQIRDHGEGIPAATLDKIFDPYFTTKSRGHGLGLAIVHSIIRRHNGQIRVTSTPGEGTLFTIYLPASQETTESVAPSYQSSTNKKRLRLLIMDDEQPVLHTVCQMVEDLGHECFQALDGDQAVQCYREQLKQQQPIDLVIMDLTIPGGRGGKDTIKDLLQVDPKVKAIVASGYSNDTVMADYRQYGFCATLPKPYSFKELAATIEAAITKQPPESK